jgi:hypothetical protein
MENRIVQLIGSTFIYLGIGFLVFTALLLQVQPAGVESNEYGEGSIVAYSRGAAKLYISCFIVGILLLVIGFNMHKLNPHYKYKIPERAFHGAESIKHKLPDPTEKQVPTPANTNKGYVIKDKRESSLPSADDNVPSQYLRYLLEKDDNEKLVMQERQCHLKKIRERWFDILKCIENENRLMGEFIKDGHLIRITNNTLTISFSKVDSSGEELIAAKKRIIENAILDVMKENIKVEFDFSIPFL